MVSFFQAEIKLAAAREVSERSTKKRN